MREIHSAIFEEVERTQKKYPHSLVTLLTPMGKILYTAPICEDIIGYTAQELTGRYFGLYVHPQDIPHALIALQDAMLNDKSVEVGSRVRQKNGTYIFVRGFAWRLTDPASNKTYLLTHSKPLPSES